MEKASPPTRCATTHQSTSRGGARPITRATTRGRHAARGLRAFAQHGRGPARIEVGPKTVVNVAHRLGITSPLQANASIALGTSEVSPLELTGAYAAFAMAARGDPLPDRRREGGERKVVYKRRTGGLGRVIDPANVASMNSMCGRSSSRLRPEGRHPRLGGRRQDRDEPGFPRRLVLRLHGEPRRNRLARQRRRHADQEGLRRDAPGRHLEPLHEDRAPGQTPVPLPGGGGAVPPRAGPAANAPPRIAEAGRTGSITPAGAATSPLDTISDLFGKLFD